MTSNAFRIEYPTGYMELMWEFFPQAYIEPSSYEKTLRKQRDKLTENAELVKKARWDG